MLILYPSSIQKPSSFLQEDEEGGGPRRHLSASGIIGWWCSNAEAAGTCVRLVMHFQTLINWGEVAGSKRNRTGHFYELYELSYQKSALGFFFLFLFAYDKFYRKPNQLVSNQYFFFHNHLIKYSLIRIRVSDYSNKRWMKLGMNPSASITIPYSIIIWRFNRKKSKVGTGHESYNLKEM